MIWHKFCLLILILNSCGSLIWGHGFNSHPIYNVPENYCETPLGDAGSCVSLKYCPEVLVLYQRLGSKKATEYSTILKRLCGNRVTSDQYPVLCCKTVVYNMPDASESPVESISTSTTESSPVTMTTEKIDKIIGPSSTVLCLTTDFKSGSCKALQSCPALLDQLIANPENEQLKANLRKSHAACGNEGSTICCPSVSTTDTVKPSPKNFGNFTHELPSEDEGCGHVNLATPKIVGGEESQIGAWPWMALIGYDPYSAQPFKCGGTLISNRHVITAAHCIRHDLSFVRLGEFDLTIESETTHVDIKVTKNVKHPQFGRNRRSDIAVLLLDHNVQFTDLISPICMPSSIQLRSKSYVDSMPYVAGWGKTQQSGSSSHILKQAQLPILENNVCRRMYKQLLPNVPDEDYDDSIICAGYTLGGADTCQGDSGGPLMIPELYKGITKYYLIGIVSYGHGCSKIPGIYISTQHWMDWIVEQVENM